MRRIVLLAAALGLALAPPAADAQVARGGFLTAGQGGGGTALMRPRFSVDMAYVLEVAERDGPYVGGRYTLGIHYLRADEAGFHARYGAGEVRGGGGTLYDTGGDIEVGYGVGVLRVYGFAGIHYYQQFQERATVGTGEFETEVITRSRQTIAAGRGVGVHLRLTDTGGIVGEWYRGGGRDGVMPIDGARFGLRWAW